MRMNSDNVKCQRIKFLAFFFRLSTTRPSRNQKGLGGTGNGKVPRNGKVPGKKKLGGAKEPETAKKIGFTPAKDFNTALSMARERAGKDAAIANMVIPPIFCADIKR
jgi:hypothetical protein